MSYLILLDVKLGTLWPHCGNAQQITDNLSDWFVLPMIFNFSIHPPLWNMFLK